MSPLIERRDSVRVGGPDALTYLQGQLSNDLAALAVGESCWSFVLDPTGKLGHLVRVLRHAESVYILDVDEGAGQELAARLRRFLIRTKATIELGTELVALDETPGLERLVGWWGEGEHTLVTDRTGGPSDRAAITAARVAAGWPAHGHELVEGVIPGETGLVPVAVSFTKGCYTGQELVARIDSRGGNVPKHLRRLRLTGPASIDDAITVDGLEVGIVTSVAGDLALGYVHRSVEPPAAAEVAGHPATIEPLHA